MITSVNLLDQNDKKKNYIPKMTINQTQRIYFLFFTFKNSKLLLTHMANMNVDVDVDIYMDECYIYYLMKYHMNG